MDLSNFSLDDFKKWIAEQDRKRSNKRVVHNSLVGTLVESRISPKRLKDRMMIEEGDSKELIRDFIKDGGIVLEVNDKDLLIQVDSGTFYLSRKYITK